MKLELSNEVLQRRVFRKDLLDLHAGAFLLGLTKELVRGKNVADVGAATGMYAWYWSQFANQVVAFEAVPPVFEQLKKVEEQRENVLAYNIAIGKQSGKAKFFVDDKRLSNSGFQNHVGGQEIETLVATIDDYYIPEHTKAIAKPLGFLKVDTEGSELDVLKGASQTIERDRPDLFIEICPEFNTGDVADTFTHCLGDLNLFGYYTVRGSQKLYEVLSVQHGVDLVKDKDTGKLHDYDFLFSKESLV